MQVRLKVLKLGTGFKETRQKLSCFLQAVPPIPLFSQSQLHWYSSRLSRPCHWEIQFFSLKLRAIV